MKRQCSAKTRRFAPARPAVAKTTAFPVVSCGLGQQGNVGITILSQMLLILVAGFLVWGLLPEHWKAIIKAGPWKSGAIMIVAAVIVIALGREILQRREHRRAHARVAKVFREAMDSGLQKRSALWLIDHNRKRPERLADAGPRLYGVLLSIMKADPEKLDRARAANGLGVLGDAQAIEHLLVATKDEYPYVRAEAAFALGRLKAVQAEPWLKELAKDDWDAGVRGRAKEALAWLGRPLGN